MPSPLQVLHRTIENNRIHLALASLPAPGSPDRFHGGSLSFAPSNLLRHEYDPPQSNLPELDPLVAQNVVEEV